MDSGSINQYKHRRLFGGFYHVLELRDGRLKRLRLVVLMRPDLTRNPCAHYPSVG